MNITVRVPATSANLGPGFDSMGLALDLAGEVALSTEPESPNIDGPGERLVREAALRAFEAARLFAPESLHIAFVRNIPAGRGLGASALARAAGLVGANEIMGHPLDAARLLALGAELEGHPDNIAPALFGGLQVMAQVDRTVQHVRVPVPAGLSAVVMVPGFDMPTEESRRALPASLSREDAVFNISRAALVVAALATGSYEVLRVATQDRLHQPARAKIFPALDPAIEAALTAGAHGAFLSGGGSSVLALTTTNEEAIGEAMVAAASANGFAAEYIVTRPSRRGATVVA